MSSSKNYVFISSDGKIWQKADLTREAIVADLKFATLFISIAQGASVHVIEDTLSKTAVEVAHKFLTARGIQTVMVMWWKSHVDWTQNMSPKGERRDLVQVSDIPRKIAPAVPDPKSTGAIPQSELRKYAKRSAPARDGVPPEFQALWRMCKIVDGYITVRMQALLDSQLRTRMGFSIKVMDSVVQYTKEPWTINVEYFESKRGSKVIISKNGQQVTAAVPAKKKIKLDPKVAAALKKFVDAYRAYHTARGATFDMDVATSYKVQDLLNSYRGNSVEYMVAQIGAEVDDLEDDLRKLKQVKAAVPPPVGAKKKPKGPSLKDRIRAHPAVQSVDDGGPGDFFVNLKTGYEWSGQRSFGTDNASHAARLLKEVRKVESVVATRITELFAKTPLDQSDQSVEAIIERTKCWVSEAQERKQIRK